VVQQLGDIAAAAVGSRHTFDVAGVDRVEGLAEQLAGAAGVVQALERMAAAADQDNLVEEVDIQTAAAAAVAGMAMVAGH